MKKISRAELLDSKLAGGCCKKKTVDVCVTVCKPAGKPKHPCDTGGGGNGGVVP